MPIRPENRRRYPANWPEISLRIRTDRARGRCECAGECGRGTHSGRCPNRQGAPAYGTGSRVQLTVAHLDHTPENCDDANLRAMCQGCHLHYDRDHHRQTAAHTRRAALEAAGQIALSTEGPTYMDDDFGPETQARAIALLLGAAETSTEMTTLSRVGRRAGFLWRCPSCREDSYAHCQTCRCGADRPTPLTT